MLRGVVPGEAVNTNVIDVDIGAGGADDGVIAHRARRPTMESVIVFVLAVLIYWWGLL
ncbi:hypothetical protein [Rhodococcus phenolicus]|uniref:hypothetical protein n=1 Tax=Rhodococcus phenolicus TaxID=263849 RepID=UPI000AAB2036|nr:hypothetical protein [Rhodococcus phenolicus]